MKKLGLITITMFALALAAYAQPRPAESVGSPAPKAKPAPASFEAKYEGGLFGFTEKEEGTLKFDDENQRIVFFCKKGTERFGIPYKSLMVISPSSQSVTSNTGNVVRHIPLPGAGIAGGLIKEKRRYMMIQFTDPDAEVSGTVSFKVEDKELLDSVIQTLGEKAQLKQRGDAYYRPRPKTTEI